MPCRAKVTFQGKNKGKTFVLTVGRFSFPRSDSKVGLGKRGLLEKGSFQRSPFSRDSREFRDSRDFRELPDCGKQRRIRPFSRDSREFRDFRDSRDSSSEKTPFVMTPFSGPEKVVPHVALGETPKVAFGSLLSGCWLVPSQPGSQSDADLTFLGRHVCRTKLRPKCCLIELGLSLEKAIEIHHN